MNEAENLLNLNQDEAEMTMLRAQLEPLFHVEQVQGCTTLEEYQKKILQAIVDNDRVCIRSPHDVGKTFLMAKVVLWFCSSFPGAKVITTAPTYNQVKRLLWSEIRAGWKKSKYPLGGEMLMTEWKISEDWFAVGFTGKGDKDAGEGQGTASSFQGFHAPHILILFDEATGIARAIWNQVEGMLTSAHVKFVAIGNPTSRQSEFFKCFKDPAWHKIKITCFDSPNLKANGINHLADLEDEVSRIKSLNDEGKESALKAYNVIQPQLLTTKACVLAALKWGLKHPLFVAKFLGEFPEEDDNVIISLGDVEKAQIRWQNMKDTTHAYAPSNVFSRTIGVDCARYGPDKTVIVMLEDNYMVKREVMAKSATTEITGAVTAMMMNRKRVAHEEILVDGTGLGAGVVDELIANISDNTLRSSVSIREIHFGAGFDPSSNTYDEDRKHYFNLKAKMFKLLGDSLRSDLAIMPEQVYLEELPTIIYHFTTKGQLAIESKDDYKARTGLGSPDDSDALALANFGRVDTGNVGRFTEKMTKLREASKPHAAGIREGNNW